MGKRSKAKKEGLKKPKNGNSRPPDGLMGPSMPKGKKAKAQQRAALAASLDRDGAGFSSARSASQKKNSKRTAFAY